MVTKTGVGHGEGKLYVGSKKANKGFWTKNPKCRFQLKDLNIYMDEARDEYANPQQVYKVNTRHVWKERRDMVRRLKQPDMEFTIRNVDVESDRYYINSDDPVWHVFRTVMLPSISYLSIFRHRDRLGATYYLFRPFLDSHFSNRGGRIRADEEERRIRNNKSISKTQRDQLIRARVGQGRFRAKLLTEWPMCMMTEIDDLMMLVASHIKPWAASNNRERLDPNNGLVLSPTFDRLFDKGLISFKRKGLNRAEVMLSDHLSTENARKIGIINRREFHIQNMDKKEKYMRYHRKQIFRS